MLNTLLLAAAAFLPQAQNNLPTIDVFVDDRAIVGAPLSICYKITNPTKMALIFQGSRELASILQVKSLEGLRLQAESDDTKNYPYKSSLFGITVKSGETKVVTYFAKVRTTMFSAGPHEIELDVYAKAYDKDLLMHNLNLPALGTISFSLKRTIDFASDKNFVLQSAAKYLKSSLELKSGNLKEADLRDFLLFDHSVVGPLLITKSPDDFSDREKLFIADSFCETQTFEDAEALRKFFGDRIPPLAAPFLRTLAGSTDLRAKKIADEYLAKVGIGATGDLP